MDIAYNEAVDIPLVQQDDLIAMRSNVHGFAERRKTVKEIF